MSDIRQIGWDSLSESQRDEGVAAPATPVSLADFLPDSLAAEPEVVAMSHALDPQIGEVANSVWQAMPLQNMNRISDGVLDALGRFMGVAGMQIWKEASPAHRADFLSATLYRYGIIGMRRRSGTVGAIKRMAALLGRPFDVVENPSGFGTFYYYIDFTQAVDLSDDATVTAHVREYCRRFGRASCKLAKIRDISSGVRNIWVA